MSQSPAKFSAPAPLVAVAGWLVPGSGYWLIGEKLRGAVIGITILSLFMLGVLLAGIRVIDVPGYDDRGHATYFADKHDANGTVREFKNINGEGRWSVVAHPLAEIGNKPWFVGQVLAGPVCIVASAWSNDAAKPSTPVGVSRIARSHGRIYEIGTLYTAVAGMLNLLALIDAAYRAGQGA